MVTASSREALRRSFNGIAVEIQGTDYSEVAHDTGVFVSIFLQPSVLIFFPSLGEGKARSLIIYPSIILHSSPTHVLVACSRSIKFYRSAVGNKALSHY